jgi:hypothetical protein
MWVERFSAGHWQPENSQAPGPSWQLPHSRVCSLQHTVPTHRLQLAAREPTAEIHTEHPDTTAPGTEIPCFRHPRRIIDHLARVQCPSV